MESIEQNIKNKPENKESDFFQKLERIIPKNIAYLVAGISLLLAVEEASGQEKPIFSEKIKPTNQQERILNQNEETLFNEKFNFSVQPKIKRFIITERDAEERRVIKNILNDPLDSLFNFCSSFSSKSDIKDKREIGFYTLVKGVSIDGPQKFLDQYKIEHKDINFKIDSLETRRTLDKEDYKKIFTGFFQEEELKLILDCVSVVQIIDSPEEERKIPGRYGIEGERAAHFKRGENKIELLKATHSDSAIAKFIEKKGQGVHHIAFAVNDIKAEMKRLKENGFILLNDEPKKGADNKLVCFIHPKSANGVLIELCQDIIKVT